MPRLAELIPDVNVLIALAPEELASCLLKVAKSNLRQGKFHLDTAWTTREWPSREDEVAIALAEAWNWLRVQGLVVKAPGMSDFFVISRRGQNIANDEDFVRYRAAAEFPKGMLHRSIADKVWLDLARGDLADAVFTAFRAVEEAVRKAGGYGPTDLGIDLMRK